MASETFYPAVSGDDGLRYDSTSFNTDWTTSYIGRATVDYKPFIRFPNIGIPASATILSAFLRFKCTQVANNTICNLRLQFNDEDNAIAPTSYSGYDALVKTTAVVNWDNVETWVLNVSYDSPDISSLIQEIVDRSGWLSGNAMMFLGDDNSSDDNTYKRFYTYDNGSGCVELHVIWEDPLPEVLFTFSDPIPMHLSTVYGTTKQLHLTATMSGVEESYTYNAAFYDEFDVQIGSTVSGVNSGISATSNAYLLTPSGIDYNWYVTVTSSGIEDTSPTYTFSNRFLYEGYVTENDNPVNRMVRLYYRNTGELIDSTTSSGGDGHYSLGATTNDEHFIVAFDDEAGEDYNSLILDRLLPNEE